jgi:hypothetical protein
LKDGRQRCSRIVCCRHSTSPLATAYLSSLDKSKLRSRASSRPALELPVVGRWCGHDTMRAGLREVAVSRQMFGKHDQSS